MTKRDILSIAFKILGVSWASYIALLVPAIAFAFEDRGGPPEARAYRITSGLVTAALVLCIAYVLLQFADPIADRLAGRDSQVLSINLGAGWERTVFALAVRIIGVMVLARGLPRLISDGFRSGLFTRVPPSGLLTTSGILDPILTLAVGIYLLSGAKHLVNFVFRGRTAPTETGPAA